MKTNMFTPALLALALFAVACGKDNESGKSSGRYYSGVGTYSGTAPANTNNPYVQNVFQLPCLTSGGYGYGYGTQNQSQRIGTGVQLNINVAANSSYVGVSNEGDIAVVTGDNNGRAVLSLYLCNRGASVQPAMYQNPALGQPWAGCRVNPITAADVYYGSQIPIKFYALDAVRQLGGYTQYHTQVASQVCF